MLLFLHGFLGQKEDWDPLLRFLPSTTLRCAINLPYDSTDVVFAVKEMVSEAEMVIGYSAGGRIALELKEQFPNSYEKIIAISAHPGLKTQSEKHTRWQNDQKWIRLLKSASMETFLEKWYNQELFFRLKNHPDFPSILERRKTQNPQHLSHFLEHFSLAKQKAPEIDPDTIFIHGKEDLKYAQLYRTLTQVKNIFPIENASHAVHLENPKACANIIIGALNEYN